MNQTGNRSKLDCYTIPGITDFKRRNITKDRNIILNDKINHIPKTIIKVEAPNQRPGYK